MSTCIHLHIEYREEDDEPYQWFASPAVERSYLLFALLAGVRRKWINEEFGVDVTPMYPLRGVPEDAAYRTRRQGETISPEESDSYEYWDQSLNTWKINPIWHSSTYLSKEEFESVIERYRFLIECYMPDSEIEVTVLVLRDIIVALRYSRVIFWFDS